MSKSPYVSHVPPNVIAGPGQSARIPPRSPQAMRPINAAPTTANLGLDLTCHCAAATCRHRWQPAHFGRTAPCYLA